MSIGDYYERKENERKEAAERLCEATRKHKEDHSYQNYLAMLKAREDLIDAGNTGD